MPFPNEHSARLQDPDDLTPLIRVRRTEGSGEGNVQGVNVPESIDVIWYVIRREGEETPVAQALRFPTSSWTEAEARAWLKDKDIKFKTFEKAEPVEACCPPLSFASEWHEMAEPVTGPDGIMRGMYRKELIRVGRYVQGEERNIIEITPELLGHWASTFAEMTANGVEVPLLMAPNHEEDDQDRTRGWLRRMTVEADSLYGEFEVIGEDAITSALRNQVSIVSLPTFVDGKGKKYSQPIVNVALTDHPLIPGLGDWQKIAASLEMSHGKGKGMWKRLAKALGMSEADIEKLTDENGLEKILEAIKAKDKAHEAALKDAKKAATKAALDSDEGKQAIADAVEARTDEIKASLTPGEPKEIDGTLLKLASENRETKLNALVDGARLTPACREKMKALFVDEAPLKAALQHGTDSDNFSKLIEILAENDPIKLAEQTGAQVTKAALPKPGEVRDEDNPLLKDAEARAEAAGK